MADIRKKREEDLARELQSHLELEAEEQEGRCASPEDARFAARRALGNTTSIQEATRAAWGFVWLEELAQDLRYGCRALRQSPGFAAVAILTAALGIGANAIVFSVLNALILRPLNLPGAQDLYMIEIAQGKEDSSPMQSYPDYIDMRDRNRSFEDLALYQITQAGLDTGGNATPAWLYETSGNYFDSLGIQPYLGRFFHRSDERGPNSAPYIVLSYPYWWARFHGDSGVVGRMVQLNKQPYTIVGVAPPSFRGTELYFTPDFWVPIVDQQQVENFSAEIGNFILSTPGVPASWPSKTLCSPSSPVWSPSRTRPAEALTTSAVLIAPATAGVLKTLVILYIPLVAGTVVANILFAT